MLLFAFGVRSEDTGNLESVDGLTGWKSAMTDLRLVIYLLVNTLFITYIALVNSNLPLYLINFQKLDESVVSNLFTFGYVGLGALIQIPTVQAIARLSYLQSLILSIAIWGIGFGVVGLWHPLDNHFAAALLPLVIFAIATVIYKPTASAWIAAISPANLRGAYTAIAYQCWAIGYFIGPIAGGWALDQPATITHRFWLVVGLSTIIGILTIQYLQQQSPVNVMAQAPKEPT
jgi:MFS family permease